MPTEEPTLTPTSMQPTSMQPTNEPTSIPTYTQTPMPTEDSTPMPTFTSSDEPSSEPTTVPTSYLYPSSEPSAIKEIAPPTNLPSLVVEQPVMTSPTSTSTPTKNLSGKVENSSCILKAHLGYPGIDEPSDAAYFGVSNDILTVFKGNEVCGSNDDSNLPSWCMRNSTDPTSGRAGGAYIENLDDYYWDDVFLLNGENGTSLMEEMVTVYGAGGRGMIFRVEVSSIKAEK
jgi:hypothetical protein